jgi:hypothetical protein
MIRLYGLSVSPAYFRACIRAKFEENRYVSDPRVVDVLLHKSHLDYQEVMNQWKNTDHVLGILLQPPKRRGGKTFMQKFLEGAHEGFKQSLWWIEADGSVHILQVGTRMRHFLQLRESTRDTIYILCNSLLLSALLLSVNGPTISIQRWSEQSLRPRDLSVQGALKRVMNISHRSCRLVS